MSKFRCIELSTTAINLYKRYALFMRSALIIFNLLKGPFEVLNLKVRKHKKKFCSKPTYKLTM